MPSVFIGLKLLEKGDSGAFRGIFNANTPNLLYTTTSRTVLSPIFSSTVSMGCSG